MTVALDCPSCRAPMMRVSLATPEGAGGSVDIDRCDARTLFW